MTFNDDDDAVRVVAATPEYTAPKTFLNGFGSHISTIVKNINNCLYNWWYISYYHFSLVTTTFVTDYDGWPRLDHQKLSDWIKIISGCCTLLLLGTKVSFFWDQSQDMNSSGFPPKNRPLIGRPDRSANQRPVFLVENHLSKLWS